MNKKEKTQQIQSILDKLYPKTPIPLKHKDAFTLLIAVILSGNSTDKAVNKVTPALFKVGGSADRMSKLPVSTIRKIITPAGLAPTKSKNIKALSQILVKKFNGRVPDNFKDLESLPGVGHKTASVVMSQAFGHSAFPVDTHIHRLATRWGLSNGKNVLQTEKDLKKVFPENKWNKLHLQIIYFGREHCPARFHDKNNCPICSKLS
ncbi:endonuclease III [Patescibacteria group bacterium]|nr:endonuclease III [Patescibacteria group bacterium]